MAEETVENVTGNEGEVVATGVNNETNDITTGKAVDDGASTETTTVAEDQQGAETDTTTLDFNNIKVPDGVSVTDEDKANFQELVNKFGFKDQNGLQNFVDWIFEEAKKNEESVKQEADKANKEWETIKAGWKTTLESDADFGKEYDLNIKRANDAMSKFGGSELIDWLKQSDLSGHPALVKTFARIGKEIEDARLFKGSVGVEKAKVQRDRYGNPKLTFNE